MFIFPWRCLLGSAVLCATLTGPATAHDNAPTSHIDTLRQHYQNGRAALLLIEYQNEWLAADGKIAPLLQDQPQRNNALAASATLLAAARAAGLPVIHAGLRFEAGHPELGQARYGLREAIARVGTFVGPAADFQDPFRPRHGEFIVSGRNGASAFSGSNLDSYLRNQGIDTLLIAGFALHVCVESTLRAAHDLGYTAIVVDDASAAFTAEQRAHVLNHVVHHFGHAMPSTAVIQALTGSTR